MVYVCFIYDAANIPQKPTPAKAHKPIFVSGQEVRFILFLREVVAMKAACGSAHMKSILAIGELGSMNNVFKVRISIIIKLK